MTDAPGDLIDGPAAAIHFGVAPATIRSWVARYDIPRYGRESRRVLYSLDDLYEAERRAASRNPRVTA